MDLENTLIIEASDTAAESKFTDLIENNNFIIFVVLGDSAHSQTLVQTADILADDHTGKIERRVAWIKVRDQLKDTCLAYLKTLSTYDPSDYDDTIGFVLSPRHHECDYVFLEGDEISDFTVGKAYWKASLREREES